ncbi:MAG: YciI family protein [Thermomicrobiales bacterium]
MLLIKSDPQTEAGDPPAQTFIDAIGAYNDELTKAGTLVDAVGFQPSAKGAILTLKDGERILQKGPLGDPFKLNAGYWIIQVSSRDEAIDWAKRVPFAASPSASEPGWTGEIEVRQIFDTDEFPVSEEESGWREQEEELRAQPPTRDPSLKRFFCTVNADANSEAGVMPDEDGMAEMGAFIGEMASKGVFLSGDGLHPTSEGARVTYQKGVRSVTDGPFIETKELFAGYALLQAKSLDEAIEFGGRFLDVDVPLRGNTEGQTVIREIFDA